MSQSSVAIVIPVFNKSELTERCLASLFAAGQTYAGVWVIDNGSTDDTAQVLARYPQVQVIKNNENRGFGRACNQGVRAALEVAPEWLVILNNDTWLMPGWARALATEASRLRLDCIGPFFDERPDVDPTQAAKDFLDANPRPRVRKHFVPMLMFWRVSSLRRLLLPLAGGGPQSVSLFDERFFVTYEDTDLLHRARALGMRWGETNQCYMWHASRATRGDAQLMPSNYEQEGLRLFIEKWGFDPRKAEHTFFARWARRLREGARRKGKW